MTTFVITIEGLFLALSLLAEVMDRWTTSAPGPVQPQLGFPNCFAD